MKKIKTLFILIAIFASCNSIGQVIGRVLDRNDNPIVDVNIIIENTERGTISNALGYFQLDSLKQGDKIILSHIGYTIITLEIPKTERFKVYLEQNFKFIPDLNLNNIPPKNSIKNESSNSGITHDSEFMIVEESASYPGGILNFNHDIGKSLSSLKYTIEKNGPLVLLFEVTSQGKTKVIDHNFKDSNKVNEKLKKAIEELESWAPGKQRGKSVSEFYKLIIKT